MHVIFINYNKFIDTSGIHIYFLANELEKMGIGCTVCIPKYQEKPDIFGPVLFKLVQFNDMRNLSFLDRLKIKLKNPVLHAWTPRENVRLLTTLLSRTLISRYYVHLEDNEENILEAEFSMPFSSIQKLPLPALDRYLRGDVIHPLYYKQFLAGSAGVTCIIDTLAQFVPQQVPGMTFWPACEPEFHQFPYQPDNGIRHRLGLAPDETVLAYTGNMHKSNTEEITNLYQAIGQLNKEGYKVTLLRTGTDSCDYATDVMEIRFKYVKEYGSCSAEEIRDYISASDILVQPGTSNAFNDFRFPSKLPMYLASGRPVVLPDTNIGRYLEDGHNCLKLGNGSVEETVNKIKLLIDNDSLRIKLGTAGRDFAKQNFNWSKAAKELLEFYKKTRPSLFRKSL